MFTVNAVVTDVGARKHVAGMNYWYVQIVWPERKGRLLLREHRWVFTNFQPTIGQVIEAVVYE